MKWALATWALGASACALSAEIIEVPTDGACSIVLLESIDGMVARSIGLDTEGSTVISVPAPAADEASWTRIRYDCGLEALGIPSGDVPVSTGKRPFPAATGIDESSVTLGVAEPFVPRDAAALGELSLDQPKGACFDLAPEPPAAGVPSIDPCYVRTTDGASATIVATDGSSYVWQDGRLTPDPVPSGLGSCAGAFFGEEVGWIVTQTGELHRRGPAGDEVLSLPVSGPIAQAYLDGSSDEAFLFINTGEVIRAAGGIATLVTRTDAVGSERGGVAFVGPGEALIATGGDTLIRVKDGQAGIEAPPNAVNDPLALIRRLRFGIVVGTEGGVIFHRDANGAYTQLAKDPRSRRIRIAVDFGEGLLFGGVQGDVSQFHPGGPECELKAIGSGRISFVLGLENGLLATVANEGFGEVVFVGLSGGPPPQVCP